MNDQENHDNTIVQEGVNGKRFFILNAPPISQESEKTAPDAALDTACNNNDTKGPTKLGGDGMVVRNAREMFENVDILSDGRYFCRVCNRAYKTHATLTAHLRGSHLRHESRCMEKDCKHVSFTENERRKHQKEHDKKRAKEFSMLTQSLERPDCLPISCKKALFEQILRHNKDVPGMVKSLTDTGKIKYTCSECNQSFGHAFHASRHSEVHHCDMRTRDSAHLFVRDHANTVIFEETQNGTNKWAESRVFMSQLD
uniref:C2H2-type domain-containing protein n=1 Tax=Caenorhabditis japonica TaxID=281687 RepID=A0A8R1EV62_CAEJA